MRLAARHSVPGWEIETKDSVEAESSQFFTSTEWDTVVLQIHSEAHT